MIRDSGIIVIGCTGMVGRALAQLVSEASELKAETLRIESDRTIDNKTNKEWLTIYNHYDNISPDSIDYYIDMNTLNKSKSYWHQHSSNTIPKPIIHNVHVSTRNKLHDKRRAKQSVRRAGRRKHNKYIKVL